MVDQVLQAVRAPEVVARFYDKVYIDPRGGRCWIWTGAISGKGHGRFWVRSHVVVIAHRLAYAIANPTTTVMPVTVSHRCDTPVCQNPDHLKASNA